jgi:beta-glucosidase
MPWFDAVQAVLVGWFGGQEMGRAVADLILGHVEPTGRLPTTWPGTEEDIPVLNVTPGPDHTLPYSEGIHVGYRAWLKAGTTPLAPFGHGLGYTTFEISNLRLLDTTNTQDGLQLQVDVTNTGRRPGRQLVQAYLSRPDSRIDRPVRWLAGYSLIQVDPGSTRAATIAVPTRAFQHWDDGWHTEPGAFTVHVGPSSADLPVTHTIQLP